MQADALVALVNAQIALPEEAALKLAHAGHFAELDVGARERALIVDLGQVADPAEPAGAAGEPSAGATRFAERVSPSLAES